MAYTTIDKPDDYFNTILYTGTGVGGTNAITGVGFQPDWVWIKDRGSNSHRLTDSVRGVTKILYSDLDFAEVIDADTIQSFDADGFTLGGDADTNGSGQNFVSWNWLAANGTVSNTAGSITSTVSANTTSGFSIVSYTGTGANADVGHGLGSAPKMIIFKNRNTVTDWDVYIEPVGAGKRLYLNSTVGEQVATNYMNNTAPTSTLFSVGVADNTNKSGSPQIAYCFADVKGFSKFGSYTGNGSTDGPFVYTGFKPAFVIAKNATTGATSWEMADNKRALFNVNNKTLKADTSGAEQTYNFIDFLSNGFKLRYSSDSNTSGNTIIYMAFAENPFVTSTGIPTTAR
jgi:hypothetical protein